MNRQTSTVYNATVKIVDRNERNMIFRVYPQDVKMRYRGGQYGALGLNLSEERIDGKMIHFDEDKLIKRAYSVSNPLLDENDEVVLPANVAYYEFYVDLVPNDDQPKPRLSPRLFSLSDGDGIFLGPKMVGHYTLAAKAEGKHILLISTTTGESPHNSMVAEALGSAEEGVAICNISLWPNGHESMYKSKHGRLQEKFAQYRYLSLQDDQFARIEDMMRACLSDARQSQEQLGREINAHNTHVFLCGAPRMIGAPVKLGAWKYEYPDYGLMKIFEEFQFTPVTRFKPGNISYEAYW